MRKTPEKHQSLGKAATTTPRPLIAGGLIAMALVIIAAELIFLPNLTSNPGILALAILTPLLAVAGTALSRSGLRARLPGYVGVITRGALIGIVVLDLVVLVLPMFSRGGEAHDATPIFTAQATATATSAGSVPPATGTSGAATPTSTPALLVRSGDFDARPSVDTVAGKATLGTTTDGQKVLSLTSLRATNGPDLYVYLTSQTAPTGTNGAYEVARLKAPNGDQTYVLPVNLDLSQYHAVMIYCKSFSVVFGFAALAP